MSAKIIATFSPANQHDGKRSSALSHSMVSSCSSSNTPPLGWQFGVVLTINTAHFLLCLPHDRAPLLRARRDRHSGGAERREPSRERG